MRVLRKYGVACILIAFALRPACHSETVDPAFVTETKLLAFDGESDDEFGVAVAIDGTTAATATHSFPRPGAPKMFYRVKETDTAQ